MRVIITAFIVAFCSLSCCDITTEVYAPVNPDGHYILTPPAPASAQIHGASLFGVRPGHPFLYSIPATGERPMRYSVKNLPEGLSLCSESGVISGVVKDEKGSNIEIVLVAENAFGRDEKPLEIIIGEQICLTPPLGWNSWNCWGARVTQANVEASAQAMYDKGLVNYGWTYINIDDGWQGNVRGGKYHAIQPDKVKFPDMQAMCDKIHAMGMKVGIYSSPWVTTYAKYIGGSSYTADGAWDRSMIDKKGVKGADKKWQAIAPFRFEANDAKQWAEWGMDYLKYDWYLNDSLSVVRMAKALRESGRDIVFSLSNSAPQELANVCKEYAQVWRTTGDLKDRWSGEGNHKAICDVWPIHRSWLDDAFRGSAGHFPDPDMLVVGNVDHGKQMSPSNLTPDEQYSHISLWSLWSAPLLIGCPIEQLDEFTLGLLTNSEVLALQQDRLAEAGASVIYNDEVEIICKRLYGGDIAVGLFNLTDSEREITIDWQSLGVDRSRRVRDLWRQRDIGRYNGSFTARVASHGVILVRMSR
ncbi:MAG: glycoside hydrolase family 27 protein [Rikenellaceae bacterium]